MRKTRLSVVCLEGLNNFLQWKELLTDSFEIKVFIIRNEGDILKAIGFGDVIWCEWCNDAAVAVTNHLDKSGNKNSKKVIVRLHSYEALSNYPRQMKWNQVNDVIYVAEHIPEIINTYFRDLNINERHDTHIIPNGVDIDNIEMNKVGTGFNICSVGAISHKKNPTMMLQVFNRLHEIDNRYRLHVAGAHQDARYEIYLNHMVNSMQLAGSVIFYGDVKDMNEFYKGKDLILHTSVHEGHCVSIIEAMARGIHPIVHNFYGAERQYVAEVLFNTVDEAIHKIRDKLNVDKAIRAVNMEFERVRVRQNRWTITDQVKSFKEIINGVIVK